MFTHTHVCVWLTLFRSTRGNPAAMQSRISASVYAFIEGKLGLQKAQGAAVDSLKRTSYDVKLSESLHDEPWESGAAMVVSKAAYEAKVRAINLRSEECGWKSVEESLCVRIGAALTKQDKKRRKEKVVSSYGGGNAKDPNAKAAATSIVEEEEDDYDIFADVGEYVADTAAPPADADASVDSDVEERGVFDGIEAVEESDDDDDGPTLSLANLPDNLKGTGNKDIEEADKNLSRKERREKGKKAHRDILGIGSGKRVKRAGEGDAMGGGGDTYGDEMDEDFGNEEAERDREAAAAEEGEEGEEEEEGGKKGRKGKKGGKKGKRGGGWADEESTAAGSYGKRGDSSSRHESP